MKFYILTLFPEMVLGGLATSIIGRAVEAGILSIEAVNIRDFSANKHQKVDDYPYGGGAGMLMQAQPVYDAWKSVVGRIGHKPRCVYVTPQGTTFTQAHAKSFAKEEDLILLCGHYEGIDQRVLEEIVTDYMSIGDYVLTGGELPAMVIPGWFQGFWAMRNPAWQSLLRETCWSTPSIPAQRNGMEGRCPQSSCPGTIKISKHGAGSSPSC